MFYVFIFVSPDFSILLRPSLLNTRKNTIYNADIIYGKRFNESFKRKIEMVQYKAGLVYWYDKGNIL